VDLGQHLDIGRRGGHGLHIGDQVRPVGVTAFGPVHGIAVPNAFAMLAGSRFRIMGRHDQLHPGRALFRRPPVHLSVLTFELLRPNLAQHLHLGQFVGVPGRRGLRQGRQQVTTISANRQGQRIALSWAFREAGAGPFLAVALVPMRLGDRPQPGRVSHRQGFECRDHGFAHQLQAVEVVGGGQDVTAIGALSTARADES